MGYTEASGHSIHGKYHAFVIATDPVTGEQYITRAGPFGSGESGYGFGPIKAQSGVWRAQSGVWSESLSFDRPSQTVYVQDVGVVDMSYTDVVSNMNAFATSINSQSINYWPTGPNSNSYAFFYIQSLGFDRPSPALGAPGWDNEL